MKIGDYARTKGGNIFKIIGGNLDDWEIDISCTQLEQTEENWFESNRYNDNGYWFTDENIIKSSPNILDLIEVGDYVNGYEVRDISYYGVPSSKTLLELDKWLGNCYKKIANEDINSILTKEQFESMEYKVGDKE